MAAAIVGLLSAACWGAAGPPRVDRSSSPPTSPTGGRLASPPATHLQVTLQAADQGPKGVLSLGDQRQTGTLGSYCWQQQTGFFGAEACLDMAPDVYVPTQYIGIESGTVLYVVGDQTTVTASLLRVTGDRGNRHIRVVQRLPLVEGASGIEARPGRYTLEVDGRWSRGDAPIFFGLLVT